MLTRTTFHAPRPVSLSTGETVEDLRSDVASLSSQIADFKSVLSTFFSRLNNPGALTLTQSAISNCTIDATPIGSTTPAAGSFTNISSTGDEIVGTGAVPNANTTTSVLNLRSTDSAAVNAGPSIRFNGASGNGVTPYSFGAIQGYKHSATAGDYSGGLNLMVIDAAGGATTPLRLVPGYALIGVSSPNTAGGTLQIGSGITFPATQVASSNANTLDDYEEGTWTPDDQSGASLSFTSPSGTYTKIGRLVTVTGSLTYPATASGLQVFIGGLPFTVATNAVGSSYNTSGTAATVLAVGGYALLTIFNAATGVALTNANMTGANLVFTLSYEV